MKRVISLLLAICLLLTPVLSMAEDSMPIGTVGKSTANDEYILQSVIYLSDEEGSQADFIEVGDQFMVEFVTDVPAFLTMGIYGSFDNSKAKIIAPVYSNRSLGVLTNQFDNDEGTFSLEGYDQRISGIEGPVVCAILFEAVAPGEFTIDLSDECKLGKPDENAFYTLTVNDNAAIIREDSDGEGSIIIKEPEPITPFDDMLNYDWAERAVGVMYELGVLEGVADTSYEPGKNITRGEFITMLMRVCKQKKNIDSVEAFGDVDEDSYQYEHIMTAKVMGIAKGDENGNFRPDEPITRQDICTLVFRTMLKMNKARSEIEAADYIGSFSDKDEVYDYAKDSVAGLIRAKLVVGDDNGLLRPNDNMTRAEAAVLLNRLADYNILISM